MRSKRCVRAVPGLVGPAESSGLSAVRRIMVDRVTTMRRSRLVARIGHPADSRSVQLNRALVAFLGIAGGTTSVNRRG